MKRRDYSCPECKVFRISEEAIICTSSGPVEEENNTGSAGGFPWDD